MYLLNRFIISLLLIFLFSTFLSSEAFADFHVEYNNMMNQETTEKWLQDSSRVFTKNSYYSNCNGWTSDSCDTRFVANSFDYGLFAVPNGWSESGGIQNVSSWYGISGGLQPGPYGLLGTDAYLPLTTLPNLSDNYALIKKSDLQSSHSVSGTITYWFLGRGLVSQYDTSQAIGFCNDSYVDFGANKLFRAYAVSGGYSNCLIRNYQAKGTAGFVYQATFSFRLNNVDFSSLIVQPVNGYTYLPFWVHSTTGYDGTFDDISNDFTSTSPFFYCWQDLEVNPHCAWDKTYPRTYRNVHLNFFTSDVAGDPPAVIDMPTQVIDEEGRGIQDGIISDGDNSQGGIFGDILDGLTIFFPFASLFPSSNDCQNLSVVDDWLGIDSQVCPFFPQYIRDAVSPIISILVVIIVFALVVHFANSHEGSVPHSPSGGLK
jgi:hypothetical protein